jgi:hypothetical protein
MTLRRSLAALLFLAVLAPAPALADISDADKATARELTIQGYDALKNKDWAGAAERFTRANQLFHAGNAPVPPTISVGLARANVAIGKLVSAQELYSKVVHEPLPPNASGAIATAYEDAQRELAALTPRVPGVVINVKGATEVRVTLDDTEVPSAALGVKRFADPGKHVVRALAVGFSPAEASVTLVEGKTETVTLELKPGPGGPAVLPPPGGASGPGAGTGTGTETGAGSGPPPDASAPLRRTVGFVGIGVGGVGLLVGAITGGLALSKHNQLTSRCPGGHCPPNSQGMNQSDINSYNLMGNLSTVGFVVGGALAATGIILVATAPSQAPRVGLVPVLGPGYAGVQGRF